MNRTLNHGALIVLALVMLGPVVTAAEDLRDSGETTERVVRLSDAYGPPQAMPYGDGGKPTSSTGEPLHSFSVAVIPSADLRVGEKYTSVFGTGGGVTLAGMFPLPFFAPLSAGVQAAYHYVPVRTAETRERFSLSLISTGFAVELTWRVLARVELGLFGAAGGFLGFITDDPPATGLGIAAGYGARAGFLITPRILLGIMYLQNHYVGLDCHAALGIALETRFGRRRR